ncbi:Autophagy-related protein 2 [Cercospora zeina]
MAWWQKKLLRYGLRYGLARTGLLDDSAIDLDRLDITVGRQNVIELRDIGLNIARISQLAQLPPAIRLETATVAHLKLTIPADFYQSSIVVEVDGVEIVSAFEHAPDENASKKEPRSRARSPTTARTPQHRKTNRRIHSPPPYDPGDASDDARLPNVQDVAKSFLLEEALDERRNIEALAYGSVGMEESFASESSENDTGTGTGVGVPGFLTNFLQGIVDRFQLKVKNVEVRLRTVGSNGSSEPTSLTLRLQIGSANVEKVDPSESDKCREVTLAAITIDILSKDEAIAELSTVRPQKSAIRDISVPAGPDMVESTARLAMSNMAKSTTTESEKSTIVEGEEHRRVTTVSDSRSASSSTDSLRRLMQSAMEPVQGNSAQPANMAESASLLRAGDLPDAPGARALEKEQQPHELDIHPGDDNVSWGSRRSRTSPPSQDLWNSMISENDLPDSLHIASRTQAAASRAESSRSSSPLALRHRRAVSPYDRAIHSPGSWPRPDVSPARQRQQRPGSWPTLDHGTHSVAEPLNRLLSAAIDQGVDNKITALEQARPASPISAAGSLPGTPAAMDESMVESQVFSHEQAQSMYMSAMTGSRTLDMPGGWESDTHISQSDPAEASDPLDREQRAVEMNWVEHDVPQFDGAQPSIEATSANATPRAQTPIAHDRTVKSPSPDARIAIVELLHIDQIIVTIPSPHESDNDNDTPQVAAVVSPVRWPTSGARGMPGTFSAYSETSASRRRGMESTHTDARNTFWVQDSTKAPVVSERRVSVAVGATSVQAGLPTCRMLHRISTDLTHALRHTGDDTDDLSKSGSKKILPSVSLHLRQLRLSLTESVNLRHAHDDSTMRSGYGLADLLCEDIVVQLSEAQSTLSIQDLVLSLGGQDLLKFNHQADAMAESVALSEKAPAIAIDVARKMFAGDKRSITELAAQTKPVKLTLDIALFDEAFDSFGGLSGILELGNSALLESSMKPPAAPPSTKGVRFAGDQQPAIAEPEIKVNARIGGITMDLRSSACAVILRTSTIKSVYREHGMIATISRVVLSGPFDRPQTEEPPLTVDIATIRIEYLMTPQDKDLERLLSLLTPSRDQYDDDGDILIDTLLRQRRKGALLRVVVDDVKAKMESLDCIKVLSGLGDDLAKLSAVTKYLPEDDKPGLLTLVRIKDAEARIPVNDRFGRLLFALQDLHLAHVGLPALLAFSIGDVYAQQAEGPELLHRLLPPNAVDGLPVIMARMIGNEIEPTVKVKLFNICVEYSVPIILALTGMDRPLEPGEVVNEMAQSIANLAMARDPQILWHSPASDLKNTPKKKVAISLLVHDSAIGLTPQRLPSKALVILNDAHAATSVPPGDSMSARVELRKAAIFLTDHEQEEADINTQPRTASTAQRLHDGLVQRGFAPIASVMSAVVQFHAKETGIEDAKAIEINVRNELFLLETCADSTQTLFATLGALAPPTPPSKVPKFQTQPMPLEDMVASFSGNAVIQPGERHETLFDVEQDPQDFESETAIDISSYDVPDDLLAASEMTGSLYGPVSGLLDMPSDADAESNIGEDAETAESLLEEDPFEMTMSPEDAHLSDAALMRDLTRQCKPAGHSSNVNLDIYEIEDLGFDALGSGQQALGAQRRFNAPFVGKHGQNSDKSHKTATVKLRLRDFHLIWHLHDGFDWKRTRDGIVDAVEQVEQRTEERKARRRRSRQDPEEEEPVIGDFLFNSIYIGVPADTEGQDLRRQINRGIDQEISETESVPASGISRPTIYSTSGKPRHRQSQRRRLKLGRSRSHKIAFELKGVSGDVLVFGPESSDVVSSVDLRVKDFEIFDKVPTSTWRKFLTHLDNDPAAREMSKPMFHIQLDNVKTLESHSASELILHVAALPLRLHVDQDALDFIQRFFDFKDPDMVDNQDSGDKPYLQRVEVETVDLCLDYKPKTVDYAGLRSGRTKEFMNFITLEGCNIRLQHAILYGLSGFDKLHDSLSGIWTPDVIQNQLPRVLSGLAPLRSLVNLGVGVRDIVAIPVREYKKDGRVVRSIQKGAFQFGKTTASELARLGAKVALGTQTMLANAEDFLTPEGSAAGRSKLSSTPGWYEAGSLSDEDDPERQRAVSAYANQPLGVLSGLRSARRHLEHDLLTAKDALIAVQGEVLDSRGPGEVAGAVVKHAPTVILRPVIGATRAVGTALLGVGNAVDRGNLRRVDDKYKRR